MNIGNVNARFALKRGIESAWYGMTELGKVIETGMTVMRAKTHNQFHS